jgi:putative transposase
VPAQQRPADSLRVGKTRGWSVVEISHPDDDGMSVGRRTPEKGVVFSSDVPLILWCTVCADGRGRWVAQADVMAVLQEIWCREADAWLVGEHVLMPDHLHFFCCPRRLGDGVTVERWVGFWKDRFAKRIRQPQWRWQQGLFHTRMRSDAHYQEKLDYMRQNPVRAGLVAQPDDWPWRGQVHDLSAHVRSFGRPSS